MKKFVEPEMELVELDNVFTGAFSRAVLDPIGEGDTTPPPPSVDNEGNDTGEGID